MIYFICNFSNEIQKLIRNRAIKFKKLIISDFYYQKKKLIKSSNIISLGTNLEYYEVNIQKLILIEIKLQIFHLHKYKIPLCFELFSH